MNSLFEESVEKRAGFAHDIDRVNGKEEWLTPPEILKAFGPFDLDPCAPANRPWPMASNHFTAEDNGLIKPWEGFVFCNPPYGSKTEDWLKRCAEHNNCLVLIFARTETQAFQKWVWPRAQSLFFIKGRLSFHHVDGKRGGGGRRAVRSSCLRRTRRPQADRERNNCRSLCSQQTERVYWPMTRAVYKLRDAGVKGRDMDGYEYSGRSFGWKAPRTSSKSSSRKKASAEIAKIPPALAQWIAKCFKPQPCKTSKSRKPSAT